jgi:hypothetical protein
VDYTSVPPIVYVREDSDGQRRTVPMPLDYLLGALKKNDRGCKTEPCTAEVEKSQPGPASPEAKVTTISDPKRCRTDKDKTQRALSIAT